MKHNFSEDQALGLLYWNSYDVKLSKQELKYFESVEEWSPSEKALFDHAIRSYGKSFLKIRSEVGNKISVTCTISTSNGILSISLR